MKIFLFGYYKGKALLRWEQLKKKNCGTKIVINNLIP